MSARGPSPPFAAQQLIVSFWGGADIDQRVRSLPPEILEPCRRQFGVTLGIPALDRLCALVVGKLALSAELDTSSDTARARLWSIAPRQDASSIAQFNQPARILGYPAAIDRSGYRLSPGDAGLEHEQVVTGRKILTGDFGIFRGGKQGPQFLQRSCRLGPPTVSDTRFPTALTQRRWRLSLHFGAPLLICSYQQIIRSYQQNGKAFAIRQPSDRFVSVSIRFRVFLGNGAAVPAAFPSACECGVNSASLFGDGSFCARSRFELVLAPSVSNPEFNRICTLKQRRHLGLVEVCED